MISGTATKKLSISPYKRNFDLRVLTFSIAFSVFS